jgi:NAD+ kinase
MLRAVDLLAAHEIPVLGVNVGHLGYLTQVEPDQLVPSLERLLDGRYEIEERMMLSVRVEGAEMPPRTALNELVVEKIAAGHTVRLAVEINDRFFATYAADGMIVATPTGSTAYSLSARGPIVSPTHRALLLTPVAPHMLFDRTLVLDATESVRLEVLGPADASLSVDGRSMGSLCTGQSVVCTSGPHSARLVTFGGRDFHQILKVKFGLADR